MEEESREIRNMRNMAWERAKGELNSMTHTYWESDERYKAFSEKLKLFITEVEFEGLQE